MKEYLLRLAFKHGWLDMAVSQQCCWVN